MTDIIETSFDVAIVIGVVLFCLSVSRSLERIALEVRQLREAAKRP